MINRVVLVGRLTRDPDLRTTGSGISVLSFTLAVDRQYTNAQGERDADFINCVIWRKAAENFANFTSKGSLVGIDGRLQTRSYENKDGQRVYVTEVVVDNFALLESRRARQERPSAGNQFNGGNQFTPQGATPANNGNAPLTSNKPQADGKQQSDPNDPFADSGKSIDISDDDLPF